MDVRFARLIKPRLRHDDIGCGCLRNPRRPPTEGAVAQHKMRAAGEERHLGSVVPCAGAAHDLPAGVGKVATGPFGVVCEDKDRQRAMMLVVVLHGSGVVIGCAGADVFRDVVVGDVVAAADVQPNRGRAADGLVPSLPVLAGGVAQHELGADVLGAIGEVKFTLPEAIQVGRRPPARKPRLVEHALLLHAGAKVPGQERLIKVGEFADQRRPAIARCVHVARAADDFFHEFFRRLGQVYLELVEAVSAQGIHGQAAAVAPGMASVALGQCGDHGPLEELVAQAAVQPADVVRCARHGNLRGV